MIKPVGKKILVQPEEQSNEKIIIVNQQPKKFKVLAIGEEITKISVGDTVFIEKHYGIEIAHENQKFLIVDENCILAKLD